jgi:hypothetical protein
MSSIGSVDPLEPPEAEANCADIPRSLVAINGIANVEKKSPEQIHFQRTVQATKTMYTFRNECYTFLDWGMHPCAV